MQGPHSPKDLRVLDVANANEDDGFEDVGSSTILIGSVGDDTEMPSVGKGDVPAIGTSLHGQPETSTGCQWEIFKGETDGGNLEGAAPRNLQRDIYGSLVLTPPSYFRSFDPGEGQESLRWTFIE
jgi:hypothetical protein